MTEQEYYSTISSCNQLIRQKGFNKHACDPKRLKKLKTAVINHIAIQIAMIERKLSKQDDDSTERCDLLSRKEDLIELQKKIYFEHDLRRQDYEGTFYCTDNVPLMIKLTAANKYNFCQPPQCDMSLNIGEAT